MGNSEIAFYYASEWLKMKLRYKYLNIIFWHNSLLFLEFLFSYGGKNWTRSIIKDLIVVLEVFSTMHLLGLLICCLWFFLDFVEISLSKDQVKKDILGLWFLKCYTMDYSKFFVHTFFWFRNLKHNFWMISEVSYALKIIKFKYEAWSDHWFPLNYHTLNHTTFLMLSSNMSSFPLW